MSRYNDSMTLSFSVLLVMFVMIFNVVSSKATWYYDKDPVIEQDSETNEIEMSPSIFINRLSKTSPPAFTEQQQNELGEFDEFSHATYQEHTSKPNLRIQPATSCGLIACDSAPGYPEDIIIEVAKSSNRIPESPKVKDLSRVNFPIARSLDDGRFPHRRMHSPEKVQYCKDLVHEIVVHPRELLNEKDQSKLLVKFPEFHLGLSARECRGPKACRDATTPEHKVFGCKSDYILRIGRIFNADTGKIERQKVFIPNGCLCGLHDV